ncbi:MAG: protein kinase [Myxococcales bacterium]|nr:protein kinase [Myxococcales bacterium]
MISVGQTVGNYKITAKLGEGGMGVVYLAEHPVIGKKVAIKAIHPELSKNPEVVSRFMTEAKSVNQIGNEHIVDISDFGNTDEGEFFFVMEFLQGEALSDRITREHRFPAARALKIAAQVADALAASHEHGIIHRDLKPENVYLINRGANVDFVKVLDFGLAKLTQGDEKVTHKTRTGSVMGTPYYMSPEQCEGRADVDQRSDVYALGVILFEMMTGKVPFGGEGYGEIIVKHITQAPPSLRAINPALEEHHEKVVLKSLAKDRAQRFQSMKEFRAAILDPQSFVLNGGSVPSAAPAEGAPASRPSEAEAMSGQVVFGAAPGQGGNRRQPAPTTFGQGNGELADDLDIPPKSHKGLAFGVAGAILVAGTAAFLLLGRGPSGPPASATVTPPAAETQAEANAEAAPDVPELVTVMFRSEPSGATVSRNDSGERLGTTPFQLEFPKGKEAIAFAFDKEGYETQTMTLVPDLSAKLAASLVKEAEKEAPKDAAKEPGRRPVAVTRPGRGSTGSRNDKGTEAPPPKPTKPRTTVDEDGYLSPGF